MSASDAEPSDTPALFVFNGSTQHRYGEDFFVYCGLTFGKSLFDSRDSNVTKFLNYIFFLKKD